MLQTDMGKHLVRLHENDFDAQAIFKKLSNHAKTSTQASIDTADLLSYITSVKLHNTNWRGTTNAFILHWCDKVRVYESLVPLSDHFTGNVKLIMLQNAVAGISELNQVKVQSFHDEVHGKGRLSYDEYKSLLLSAATTYDAKRGLSKGRAARTVNESEIMADTIVEYDSSNSLSYNVNIHDLSTNDDDITYDIDTDFSSLQIHQTDRKPQPFRPSMSKEKWNNLSKTEKELWDKFSPQTKAMILGISKPKPTASPYQRNINLHNMSASDYIQLIHMAQQQHSLPSDFGEDTSDVTASNNTIPQDTVSDNEGDSGNLLACLTKQTPPHGDLRKVLSSSSSKTSDKKSNFPQKHNSSSDNGDIIVVNGKRYRSINVLHIRYRVSNVVASKTASLVDRGANGGLAGSDVRVICKSNPLRMVDVSGIDSHEVRDLPIVTVGGVVQSQRGLVIAIMHQYALLGEGKTIHSSGQLEWYKNDVNDKSLKIGGLQLIATNDRYVHTLDINNGFPYCSMRPYTDDEWESLPHVIWTSDKDWDPSVLYNILSDKE